MKNEVKKRRHISILDYFDQLQQEYLLYELRTKIYPSKRDKEKYFDVLEFKKEKIEDISGKNDLLNIFNSEGVRKEAENKFYNEFGNPQGLSNRDRYFYYFIGSDFSYQGRGAKLLQYDLTEGMATIEQGDNECEVDLNEIKRIL